MNTPKLPESGDTCRRVSTELLRTFTPRTRALLLTLGLVALDAVACAPTDDDEVDLGPPAPDLLMPDLTGLDLPTQLSRGLDLALTADLRGSWSAFTQTMALRDTCPDIYASGDDNNDMPPLYWSDSCTTEGGMLFEGELGWNSVATRDVLSEGSYVDIGERQLSGSATIESSIDASAIRLFSFSGEGSDAFYQSVDGQSTEQGSERWTYSAQLTGTVTGTLPFEQDQGEEGDHFSGGWREDLYIQYTGGNQDILNLRGDLFLLQETFDRFDSVSLDITLYGPTGAPPGACLLEPYGYIGLRDTSAYWYEVIFLPIEGAESGAESAECDGCGTLFVRGVEQPDPVCMPFEGIWDKLSPPVLTDYIFSIRL